jgi:tetraacyldisaccharide 4'-kinase
LNALSRVYGWALKRRKGVAVRAGVPVVSVGNVACGGTGKTPVVIALAQRLKERLKVAVINRGFEDEATLVSERVPEVMVYAEPDRVVAAQQAVAEGAQLILLDDGLQQRQLVVDLHVVVVDGRNPWGGGELLPGGLLREPLTALGRAHTVVATRSWADGFEGELRQWSQAPWLGMAFEPVENLAGKRVGALCAIGQPWQFFEMLECQGAQVVVKKGLPDHARLAKDMLEDFEEQCDRAGVDLMVCTEKDAVKLPEGHRFLPVRIEPRIGNEEVWEQLISKIFQMCDTSRSL